MMRLAKAAVKKRGLNRELHQMEISEVIVQRRLGAGGQIRIAVGVFVGELGRRF